MDNSEDKDKKQNPFDNLFPYEDNQEKNKTKEENNSENEKVEEK